MEKREYRVYHILYEFPKGNHFSASVSADGLTRAESLLKEDIKSKGKSVKDYIFNGIEGTKERLDEEKVISNTLDAILTTL